MSSAAAGGGLHFLRRSWQKSKADYGLRTLQPFTTAYSGV